MGVAMVAPQVPASHSEMWLRWILSPARQQPTAKLFRPLPTTCDTALAALQLARAPALARSRLPQQNPGKEAG